MWAYIDTSIHDAYTDLDVLRKKYPNYIFQNVKYQGGDAVLARKDAAVDSFGEFTPSKSYKGITYAPIKDTKEFDISKYEKPCKNKIPVELYCGITIKIIPAQFEPRALVFDEDDGGSLGDMVSEYQKLVFDIATKIDNKEDVADADFLKLIKMAILKSYDITGDVINQLKLVSSDDILPIFAAVLGRDRDFFRQS